MGFDNFEKILFFRIPGTAFIKNIAGDQNSGNTVFHSVVGNPVKGAVELCPALFCLFRGEAALHGRG